MANNLYFPIVWNVSHSEGAHPGRYFCALKRRENDSFGLVYEESYIPKDEDEMRERHSIKAISKGILIDLEEDYGEFGLSFSPPIDFLCVRYMNEKDSSLKRIVFGGVQSMSTREQEIFREVMEETLRGNK